MPHDSHITTEAGPRAPVQLVPAVFLENGCLTGLQAPGRRTEEEIPRADLTGTGAQDAAIVVHAARAIGTAGPGARA